VTNILPAFSKRIPAESRFFSEPYIKEKVDRIRPLTKIKYFIWLIF